MESESSNINKYEGYKNYLSTEDNQLDLEPKTDVLDFSAIEYEQKFLSKKPLQTSESKSSQSRIEEYERKHNTEELSRISFLESKISDTKQDLVEIEKSLDSWRGTKRDKIRQWAEHLRELHDLGVYEMPISTIAVTIIDELKKLGVKSSLDYVREVLPEAYKNQRFRQLAQIAHEKRKTNEIKPEIEGQGCKTQGFPCDVRDIDIHPIIPIQDLKEYSPKIIGDKLQSAMEIIQHNKHALRQYEKTMFVQQKELEELAETNDIEILTAVKQENSIISTQKPTIVQKCDYSCALHDLQDTLFRTARYVEEHAEKVEEYPILDVQIDKNCAQRIANFDKIIQGFGEFIQVTNDERFAQSKWDWFETVINEERWGKNAAARKASIEGIDSVDEKTGKPKVRPLTAKTVKNNKDSVWNDMQEFSKQMDDFAFWKSFADWRKHSEFDQRIADRRLKVSPKLSESAIGGCNK